jgi:prevent-host-death family protein
MKKISVFEGKNRFSDVVASAAKGEPQVITKNGTETAVVISFDEYKRLTSRAEPLVKLMLDNPAHKFGMELDLSRDRDTGREDVYFDSNE